MKSEKLIVSNLQTCFFFESEETLIAAFTAAASTSSWRLGKESEILGKFIQSIHHILIPFPTFSEAQLSISEMALTNECSKDTWDHFHPPVEKPMPLHTHLPEHITHD